MKTIEDLGKLADEKTIAMFKVINAAIEWEQNPSDTQVKQLQEAVKVYRKVHCIGTYWLC